MLQHLEIFRLLLIAPMLVLASAGMAQQSNVTLPVPGEIVPESETGRPQLFFDARSTGFTRDGKQQILDGDVIAIGARSIVTADKVIFDQESKKITAEGHVVVLAADQILTGDRIDFFLDTADFRLSGARMIVNDREQADQIAKDVLGFSIQELSFEADRKSRLDDISRKKDEVRQNVRRKAKLGQDPGPEEINAYARLLEQEDLIKKQENPAFAHMTEARRNTLRKRRDFWEQSKIANMLKSDQERQSYFRLEGDEITKTNGNDFRAKHSLWTPCRCEKDEKPAWGVRAASTDAQLGGYATFYDALLEIKGVPVLYVPWLKIPIKDRRQSGLLMPTFTEDPVSGSGFSQPLYLDLGPNQDATIKGDMFEKRGLRAGLEFRWKRRQYSGLQLNVEGMRDRIWLKQRATRRNLAQMYSDGLRVARSQTAGSVPADISNYTGRDYTRMRLSQRDWWELNAKQCLDPDPAVSQLCEESILRSVKAPANANRGLAKWRLYDRMGERLAFVSSADVYSDRQYNPDVYIPESVQPGFDSGNGERAINPVRSRFTYDGSQYFLGLGSYMGDPSRLNDRFEGYQLPVVAQARSRWFAIKSKGLPIYSRFLAEDFRITRNAGAKTDEEFSRPWLPSGHWSRAEASILAPLTSRSAVQVDHFTDLEARLMTFDGGAKAVTSADRNSSLQSWRSGVRFQLPIDGKALLPDWLGGFSDETGRRIIQHVMNWSMTLATRPVVRRRGPYGESESLSGRSPSTWFATDRAGVDDNIAPTEFMDEYQIVTFSTTHRWKLYSELWKTIVGEQSEAHAQEMAKLSSEDRARRDLLYTMDRPVKGAEDIFSNDQTKWFTNRYQLLDTDYIEPISFGASISYDRIKEIRRRKNGRERANRPWSELDSSLGLTISRWSLSGSSKYNIYDKSQTRLAASLLPPDFLRSNISFGYSIERLPILNGDKLSFVATSEKSLTFVTSLTSPVSASWSFSRKDKINELPATDYRQKISLVYGSSSGCWGLGFSREKGYGVEERAASYLLQLNITFMGQTRELPNMSSSLERELKKS